MCSGLGIGHTPLNTGTKRNGAREMASWHRLPSRKGHGVTSAQTCKKGCPGQQLYSAFPGLRVVGRQGPYLGPSMVLMDIVLWLDCSVTGALSLALFLLCPEPGFIDSFWDIDLLSSSSTPQLQQGPETFLPLQLFRKSLLFRFHPYQLGKVCLGSSLSDHQDLKGVARRSREG